MEKRTITISLKNWKKLSQIKIKEGLRSFDEVLNLHIKKDGR